MGSAITNVAGEFLVTFRRLFYNFKVAFLVHGAVYGSNPDSYQAISWSCHPRLISSAHESFVIGRDRDFLDQPDTDLFDLSEYGDDTYAEI